MSTTSRRSLLAVTAAAVTVALSACSSDSTAPPFLPGAPVATTGSAAGTAPQGTPASGPHNRADSMFAMMMIPHHAQAIEMSDLLLGKTGIDPQVIALGQQIRSAQAPEISQMRGWLAGWGEPAPPADGTMGGMDHGRGGHSGMGMLSEVEMTRLRNANGAEAQRLFLTGMIEHHEGAIDMAEDVLDDGVNPDVHALARSILTSQRAEITTMRQLLGR